MAKLRDLIIPFKLKGEKRTSPFLEYTEYINLLMNAIKIERTDGKIVPFAQERLIKLYLIENGCCCYDKLTKKWSGAFGVGKNEEGMPISIEVAFMNGTIYSRPASYDADDETGAYFILSTPDFLNFADLIQETTSFIATCNNAIIQNVNAIKTPFIGVCKDNNLLLSIEHAIEQQQEGRPVLVVSEELGEALKGVTINTQYVADKIETIKNQWRDRLINKIGIMSANIDKKERVQVGEVNATIGQCEDYIYLLIDTFNKQMETYNIPFKMKFNGSMEELYIKNENENENENETGGQEDDQY